MVSAQEFKQDVLYWAKEVGVKPKEVHIRKMKRKLASCSSRGRLTFDVSLLNETEEARLRALLHELLHLRYPNHGRMFNSLLEAYIQRGVNQGEATTNWYGEYRHKP
jgi:hypothetical protein